MTPYTSIRYLTDADVEQTLTMAEAVELALRGIQADAAGHVAGDKFYMNVGAAGFIKPFSGYALGQQFAFVKTFSFFPGNPSRDGSRATSSMVLLFDAQSGQPVCLMDGGYVTALRTGASTAVTASYLGQPGARTLTVFGAGGLGRMHLRALACRFRLDRAYLVDIVPAAAQTCAAELGAELGLAVDAIALDDREEAVRASDILITVTTGDMPLIERDWLRPGAFVARLGSYQELALDVLKAADKVVVDNWHYVQPRIPELKMLAEEGAFGFEHVHAEWPDVVSGRRPGRESDEEVIVYVALGLWGEYAMILPEVYRRAVALGLGTTL